MKVNEIKKKMEELDRIGGELACMRDFLTKNGSARLTLFHTSMNPEEVLFYDRKEVLFLIREIALLKRTRILELTQELNKENVSFEHEEKGGLVKCGPFETVQEILQEVKEEEEKCSETQK